MSNALLTERVDEVFCVDLDGSLVATDLLWESLFQLVKREPWHAWSLPFWAVQGRAVLKCRVAERITPAASRLPYNEGLLGIIRAKRAAGVPVVLATASARGWAEEVARHLGLFDHVIATGPGQNLKGRSKLGAIRTFCERNGCVRFDYAGDSPADWPIWREARAIYVVNPSHGLARRLSALDQPVIQVGCVRRPITEVLKALRPRQWVKNLLVFVPLLTSMTVFDATRVGQALAGFVAFCCCASAIYLINDLLDLAADRAHPEKRRRPFAAGTLPLAWGPPMAALLLSLALLIAWLALPALFLTILAAYVLATTAYSLVIKSRLMADVLLLAVLYAMRIVAGGWATEIPISEWLIGFSLFFFLSLAFVKRFVELKRSDVTDSKRNLPGRGYQPHDIGLVRTFGACSGYLSLLILALYIKSDEVQLVYEHPDWLWVVCLTLVYWISRMWFLAERGELRGDPVLFAVRDRHSLFLGVLTVVIVLAAALVPGWGAGSASGDTRSMARFMASSQRDPSDAGKLHGYRDGTKAAVSHRRREPSAAGSGLDEASASDDTTNPPPDRDR